MLSLEERQKIMAENPPVVLAVHTELNAYFDWCWDGCGFGQFSVSYDPTTKQWSVDSEMMGSASSRKILHALADHIADNIGPIVDAERAESTKHFEEQEKNR